eukprot:TRINITY_DN3350_c0_g1_i1.p2 TRINITY_DN3350_c0_g1~~TRINITY_DN3350_c0_g1_i1.p2  ORF type:complete len:234 (+),score=73.56 TRINITY_DN3350_c0_g1_i1:257-958(+)
MGPPVISSSHSLLACNPTLTYTNLPQLLMRLLGARQKGSLFLCTAALTVQTDVVQRDQVKALVKAATDAYGPVDALINNAGVMPLSLLKNLHEDEWERMVDVNIKGVLNGIAAVLPTFLERKKGDLINISSDAGRKVFNGGAVYCGTKWAVEAITQGLRQETADTNIRVTSIQPGATTTELGNSITDQEVIAGFTPFRMLDADDIARSVLYVMEQPEHCSVNEVMIRAVAQRS